MEGHMRPYSWSCLLDFYFYVSLIRTGIRTQDHRMKKEDRHGGTDDFYAEERKEFVRNDISRER